MESGEEISAEEGAVMDPKNEKDPVARVIQHCGSVAKFFQKMGPKERIMEAVARLNKDIDEGRLEWQPWDESDEPLTEGDRKGWGWKVRAGLATEEELSGGGTGNDGNNGSDEKQENGSEGKVIPFEGTESEAADSEVNSAVEGTSEAVPQGGIGTGSQDDCATQEGV